MRQEEIKLLARVRTVGHPLTQQPARPFGPETRGGGSQSRMYRSEPGM